MHPLWIAAGVLAAIALGAVYYWLTDPSRIDESVSEEVEHESPGERERILFNEQKEFLQAEQEVKEDGYSEQ
jgi:hypothetical protein